jgi:hypothetical protein
MLLSIARPDVLFWEWHLCECVFRVRLDPPPLFFPTMTRKQSFGHKTLRAYRSFWGSRTALGCLFHDVAPQLILCLSAPLPLGRQHVIRPASEFHRSSAYIRRPKPPSCVRSDRELSRGVEIFQRIEDEPMSSHPPSCAEICGFLVTVTAA